MTRSTQNAYAGSTVLITGGTGSIGSDLVRTLLKYSPKQIRVLSNDENGLFEIRSELGGHKNLQFRLGDVRDAHSLESAMSGCDYVFHAAALKHVTFCEGNPYEAISTNILGTQNMINVAMKSGVRRFVLISTDKAVNPTSTLGATKLLSEKLVISASRQTERPVFSTVRFGNVVGSRGSVLVIFEKQVKEGGPITVTDPNMTRFIMATSEASELILRASEAALPGEIFVLKMRAVRVGDLAEASRIFFSKFYGKATGRIKIQQIGVQPGEKLHEELMNDGEMSNAIESDDFYIINPSDSRTGPSVERSSEKMISGVSSKGAMPLTVSEIVQELSRLYSRKA